MTELPLSLKVALALLCSWAGADSSSELALLSALEMEEVPELCEALELVQELAQTIGAAAGARAGIRAAAYTTNSPFEVIS